MFYALKLYSSPHIGQTDGQTDKISVGLMRLIRIDA